MVQGTSENDFECSLCEDKFTNKDDLEDHNNEHIKEIENIDIEDLKSGHEVFECSRCSFKSNNSDDVKNHLASHVFQKNTKIKAPVKSREAEALAKKSGDWRDLFDNDGNPLDDSSQSENSETDD